MLRLAEPRRRDVPGEENVYFYEPRGVAVVIAPWNFPLAILCGMTTAALVTGNTVIMKPAEQSAVIGAKLMEVFQEAGLPPGVVNILPGVGEEIGPTLVEHPDVAVIAFTGSRGVGLAHQPRRPPRLPPGQDHVKRVIAEMGGKNADHRRRRRRPGRGGARRRRQRLRLRRAEMFGLQPRAIVLEPLYDAFLDAAGRGDAQPARSARPRIPAARSARSSTPRPSSASWPPSSKGKSEARLAYAGDVGLLAERGLLRGPAHLRRRAAGAQPGPGRNLRPGAGGAQGPRSRRRRWRSPTARSYALTGGLYSRSPEQHRQRQSASSASATSTSIARSPAPGGSAAVRRLQAVGHRLQGGRAGLFVAVRAAADDNREHHAAWVAPRQE